MSCLSGTKGGSGVWQRIISEMPWHEVYIEPFWGRGTIARKKLPARYTIGIDLDEAAVRNGADVALMFLADGIQWIADYFQRPLTLDTASPAAGERIAARVDQSDGEDLASSPPCTFGGIPWERHFVYCDPPYLGYDRYYTHSLSEEGHRVLCRLFRRLPCPAALSSYRSRLYAAELRGCRSIVIPTVNRAGKRANEVLWLNYPQPRRYHDVRFVGTSRRQRERIRRRRITWSQGLARMQPAERQAVFEACAEAYFEGVPRAQTRH